MLVAIAFLVMIVAVASRGITCAVSGPEREQNKRRTNVLMMFVVQMGQTITLAHPALRAALITHRNG